MSDSVKKIKILGINRSGDGNIVEDGSCENITNLEYYAGSYIVSNFGCLGRIGMSLSLFDKSEGFVKAWLHFINDTTINLIYLKREKINTFYGSYIGIGYAGNYYHSTDRDEYYLCIKDCSYAYSYNEEFFTKVELNNIPCSVYFYGTIKKINESIVSSYSDSCFEFKSVQDKLITKDINISEYNISFVGNILVINDVIYASRNGYSKGVSKKDIKLDIHFKRLDKGIGAFNQRYDTDDVRTNTMQDVNRVNWFDDVTKMYSNHGSTKGFESQLLQLNKDCLKRGYFQGYSFVRYAVKLYDGSYINVSPPVLVCSGINDTRHSRYFYNSEKAETDIDETPINKDFDLYVTDSIISTDDEGKQLKFNAEISYDSSNIFLPCLIRKITPEGRINFVWEGEYLEDVLYVDNEIREEKISLYFNQCRVQINKLSTNNYTKENPLVLSQDVSGDIGFNTPPVLLEEGDIFLSSETDYFLSLSTNADVNVTIYLRVEVGDSEALVNGEVFEVPMTIHSDRKYVSIPSKTNDALRSTIEQRGNKCKFYLRAYHKEPIDIALYNFQLEDLKGEYLHQIPAEYEFSSDFLIKDERLQKYELGENEKIFNINHLRAISDYAYNKDRYNCRELFSFLYTGSKRWGWLTPNTSDKDINYFFNYDRFQEWKGVNEKWNALLYNHKDKTYSDVLYLIRNYIAYTNLKGVTSEPMPSNDKNAFSIFRRNQNISAFYTDDEDFDTKRGFEVHLKDKYNNDEEIKLSLQNFHNITGLPEEYCFWGSMQNGTMTASNSTFGARPYASMVALRKLSSIGMSIYENNIAEFDKDLISGVDIFMTLPVSIYKEECNKSAEAVVPAHRDCKSDDEIENEILASLSAFYKIKSIEYEDLKKESKEYQDILSDIDLSSEVFVSRDRLIDNTQILSGQINEYQYVYNGMVHSAGIKGSLSTSVKPFSYYQTEGEFRNTQEPIKDITTTSVLKYDNDIYKNTTPNCLSYKEIVVEDYDDKVNKGLEGVIFVSSSEQSTTYAEFLNKNGDKHFCFNLKNLEGNVAGYYPPKFLGYITSKDNKPSDYEHLEDGIVYPKNVLKVSQVNQPLFYPDAQTYQVGKGKIIAMHSNSKELSQGQSGSAPIYVFTTEGIYALIVDTSGEKAYKYVDTINQDVLINKNLVCDTNHGLVYATQEGIKILEGKNGKSITDKLIYRAPSEIFHPDLNAITDNPKIVKDKTSGMYGKINFIEFISNENTKIEYLSKKDLLVIYREEGEDDDVNIRDYAFLIDLKDGIITNQFLPVKTAIKGYPELYFILNKKRSSRDGEEFYDVPANDLLYKIIIPFENRYYGVYSSSYNDSNHSILYSNNYSDVTIETRPIKLGGEHFKSSTRVILRGFFDNYYDYAYIYSNTVIDSDFFVGNTKNGKTKKQFFKEDKYGIARAIGLYVYGSNDCTKWELLGFTEKVNVTCRDIGTTISHCSVKYLKLVFAGRLRNTSKIDYIEIQYNDKYTNKIR